MTVLNLSLHKKKVKRLALYLFACIFFYACNTSNESNTVVFGTSDLNKLNRRLLEIAMEDGFPPPIASRVYVYPHVAQYVALQSFYPDSLSDLTSKLNGLGSLPILSKTNVNAELASLMTFCNVAKKVVFSEHYMDQYLDSLKMEGEKRGLSTNVINASGLFADSLSTQIIAWLSKDQYVETRTMERYTSVKEPGKWKETPPDYQQALEPHWPKIRTLLIDSATIYKSAELPSYDTKKGSEFYKMAYRVYEQSQKSDSSTINTAWFWDDNPNSSDHKGHSMAVIHKISPPGHWLNIIHQISDKNKYPLIVTTKAYTYSAIAMFDGIISCWSEKYRTNLVRPVSYIQENIDVSWSPVIQTPPFPEYTSGHSVLSAAAASVLTNIFGENYNFNDNTAELFGMSSRDFKSFHDAAWEVSLSRFYGGIHYYNGIEEGNKQGKFIGDLVLSKGK